jgi:hypothetical protein
MGTARVIFLALLVITPALSSACGSSDAKRAARAAGGEGGEGSVDDAVAALPRPPGHLLLVPTQVERIVEALPRAAPTQEQAEKVALPLLSTT